MDQRTVSVPDFGPCEEAGGQTYALMLYALAESCEARRVLEIGAGWGHSGRAFAASLAKRDGALHSIDINFGRMRVENVAAIARSGAAWYKHSGDSSVVSVVGPLDMLYIDGDPAKARSDFDRFVGMVKPGGYVILDGYGGQSGPTEAVESLSVTYPFTPLRYSVSYQFAVHRRPVTLPSGNNYSAKCSTCNEAAIRQKWSAIDAWADAHVLATNHIVNVSAAPRGVTYQKGMR